MKNQGNRPTTQGGKPPKKDR
jgi:hypothetical protein